MTRQQATPVLISTDRTVATPVTALGLGMGGHGMSEAAIQDLVLATQPVFQSPKSIPSFSPRCYLPRTFDPLQVHR